jgi:hypothetical protein
MSEVVYLKRGERPPRSEKNYVLIECRPRLRNESIEQSDLRTIIRISPEDLADTVAKFTQRFPKAKLYVRGAPQPNESAADE